MESNKVWIKDVRKSFMLFNNKAFPNPDGNSLMPDVCPQYCAGESGRCGATTVAVFLP
ncbi:MAG: hypothetical protein WA667_13725 [Candidatus Nitrosopolaris sp.]